MFHADDYELQVLSKGYCPFCRRKTQTSWFKLFEFCS